MPFLAPRNARIGAAIAAVLIILGGIYFFTREAQPNTNTNQTEVLPVKNYTNEEYGISFSYPEGYELSERDLAGSAQRKRHVVTLIASDKLPAPQDGEGPISISLLFVQNNLDKQTAEKWVRGSSDSNFKLSPDGGTAKVSFAGKDGIIYRWDGLYNGETTALAGDAWIYAISVTFDAENDPIVRDYHQVLNSIRFTK